MLKPTYIEWLLAVFFVSLYLYIWINGNRAIKENEKKKRGKGK